MKRSEMLDILLQSIYKNIVAGDGGIYTDDYADILTDLEEAGMIPSNYINPKAIEEGLDDPIWGYIQFLDKYPEHHFTYKNQRPYEYYLEGWEPEDG